MPASAEIEAKRHAWRIEPREYERQEARRGRRHAYAQVDPRRTALVVVDMVPFFVDENPYCRGIVANINELAAALRTAGGLVAWVLPGVDGEPSPASIEFLGPEIARAFHASGGTGPLRDRVWSGLDVQPEDIVAEKTASSAFFPGRSTLPPLLEARNIDTVLITGTVTNVCCESSARDASTVGYRVIMAADANASVSDSSHNATLHTIYRTFGDVRSTCEILGLIRST